MDRLRQDVQRAEGGRDLHAVDASGVSDPVAPRHRRPERDPLSDANTDASGAARDCGSLADHRQSNYTFFRRDTQVRATADQADSSSENIYIVYDPSKPGTEVATGTTYGSRAAACGSQSGIYFVATTVRRA